MQKRILDSADLFCYRESVVIAFSQILPRARMAGEESAQTFHINVYGNAPPVYRDEERLRDD